ncbi:MAG: flavodoxin domain-containing protein, partial [Muribaculaceae bacterium]|nr:flavodoxin domain-containing protein [Muribaculaceae bacterium]
QIVGNNQTLAMVKGYYGVADHTIAIKDGEELSLGDVTLQFFLTPLVHWPETMMTLLKEEKTLFTGDAFGCFGALNGAVVDTEMDAEPYFPEMVRYYSSIVGKYGRFVQKAIARLAGAEFDTVCPTHGPVWREHLSRVVDLYDKLSRYEPLDEGATIVYGSMYGNTERMAEAVAEGLAEAGVRNISMHNASVSDLSYILADVFRHRHLVLAAPTYSDGLFPPMATVVDAIAARSIPNRRVALVGSHTWAPRAVKAMTAAFESTPTEQSVEPITIKHSPDADALASARALAHTLVGK